MEISPPRLLLAKSISKGEVPTKRILNIHFAKCMMKLMQSMIAKLFFLAHLRSLKATWTNCASELIQVNSELVMDEIDIKGMCALLSRKVMLVPLPSFRLKVAIETKQMSPSSYKRHLKAKPSKSYESRFARFPVIEKP